MIGMELLLPLSFLLLPVAVAWGVQFADPLPKRVKVPKAVAGPQGIAGQVPTGPPQVIGHDLQGRPMYATSAPQPQVVGYDLQGHPMYAPSGTGAGAGRTNTFAIVSLVASLVGAGIIAVIFGHLALGQIKRTGENGRGMALAGLIIGYVGLVLLVAWIVVVVVFLTMSGSSY